MFYLEGYIGKANCGRSDTLGECKLYGIISTRPDKFNTDVRLYYFSRALKFLDAGLVGSARDEEGHALSKTVHIGQEIK